ncbi:MAG: 1,4-alpha-glucan branching protein GlgB [Firmicutes bacterium]|nr:1,4-alpha-glucan branching protein GlgB [Bacillota bacterium]
MSKWVASPYSEYVRYLFHQGTHFESYSFLGGHLLEQNGVAGARFAVWAPYAERVSIVGDFNGWDGRANVLERMPYSGIWATFVPGLKEGDLYKYEILTKRGQLLLKADPYAFWAEKKPATASRLCDLHSYKWKDERWQRAKATRDHFTEPMLIYEVHLGSWRMHGSEDYYSYQELAEKLVDYVVEMGYTHIELLPIMEHPFDGSWGYQTMGYYAPTSRHGHPRDFMAFIDVCHQRGIGVILDWVPGHFVRDDPGLRLFDGTPCYEHSEARRAENRGWGTNNFDLGKTEVQSFLISNALFWLDVYHIDGLRVDAVASMLYLDYGRGPGEWNPNSQGGRENLEGIAFLKKLNQEVFARHPYALMMAEESTAWPLVTRPTHVGGIGFNYKWNMGWMNDLLRYVEEEPMYRKYHHNLVTFSLMYAFSENYLLPLSHDEVVHGKKSLLNKMPGDYGQKFAGLRALLGYMMGHPGKKLLFMGYEFGQFIEWKYDEDLDWHLLDYPMHRKLWEYNKALNQFYKEQPALWELDHSWDGFEWIDANDSEQSVLSFIRRAKDPQDFIIVVVNFAPIVRENYRIGVPEPGSYVEIFNSDDERWGGGGQTSNNELKSAELTWHGKGYSLEIKLPPLAAVFLGKVQVLENFSKKG